MVMCVSAPLAEAKRAGGRWRDGVGGQGGGGGWRQPGRARGLGRRQRQRREAGRLAAAGAAAARSAVLLAPGCRAARQACGQLAVRVVRSAGVGGWARATCSRRAPTPPCPPCPSHTRSILGVPACACRPACLHACLPACPRLPARPPVYACQYHYLRLPACLPASCLPALFPLGGTPRPSSGLPTRPPTTYTHTTPPARRRVLPQGAVPSVGGTAVDGGGCCREAAGHHGPARGRIQAVHTRGTARQGRAGKEGRGPGGRRQGWWEEGQQAGGGGGGGRQGNVVRHCWQRGVRAGGGQGHGSCVPRQGGRALTGWRDRSRRSAAQHGRSLLNRRRRAPASPSPAAAGAAAGGEPGAAGPLLPRW